MADYIPTRDEDLDSFANNYSTLITATPTAFGLVAGDATALAALVTAYSTALAAAVNPTTRTPVTVAAKNTARTELVDNIRLLARKIQATPTVTPAQKTSLGLTVPDHDPSPVPAPSTRPVLAVVDNGGKSLRLRLVDETTLTRRAKPDGVEGAEVYTCVVAEGQAPPSDLALWRFEGQTRRWDYTVGYEAGDVGKTAYLKAMWFNPRGQCGPESDVITATVAA